MNKYLPLLILSSFIISATPKPAVSEDFSSNLIKVVAKQGTNYTVIADISESFSITENPKEAKKSARFVYDKLRGLRIGDTVSFGQLGEYGQNRNTSYRVRASKKYKPRRVRKDIYRFVSNIPGLIKKGVFRVNNATNIHGFLLDNAPHFNCHNKGVIMILSDGVESSEFADKASILAGKSPPTPPRLKGCTVYMLGTGHGHGASSVKLTQAINRYWDVYFKAAGASFISLSQF